MARGDAAKPGRRGRGPALYGCVTVFVLAAGVFTLWATHQIDRFFKSGGPMGLFYSPPPPDPFAAENAALSVATWRGAVATPGGPFVGPPPASTGAARVELVMRERGYLADGPVWGEPTALPYDGPAPLGASSCGVVAVVAEGASSSLSRARGTHMTLPALVDVDHLWVAACAGDTLHVEGAGTARLRGFDAPGLTPELLSATGAPLDVVLAHAEAAALLAPAGYVPDDRIVRVSVAAASPPAPYRSVSVGVPGLPAHGCVPVVAVGYGLTAGGTTTRFMRGLVASKTFGSGTSDSVSAEDVESDGGEVWFRAYTVAGGGPVTPGTSGALSFSFHAVPSRGYAVTATLPER